MKHRNDKFNLYFDTTRFVFRTNVYGCDMTQLLADAGLRHVQFNAVDHTLDFYELTGAEALYVMLVCAELGLKKADVAVF